MRTKDGHTALHLCALRGHAAAAHALLCALPDKPAAALLNLADRKGRAAAELAARAGHQVGKSRLSQAAGQRPLWGLGFRV